MPKNSGFQISLARLRRIVDTLKDQPPQTPITFEYMCSFFQRHTIICKNYLKINI